MVYIYIYIGEYIYIYGMVWYGFLLLYKVVLSIK